MEISNSVIPHFGISLEEITIQGKSDRRIPLIHDLYEGKTVNNYIIVLLYIQLHVFTKNF